MEIGLGVEEPDGGELAEKLCFELADLLVVAAELEGERLPGDGRLAAQVVEAMDEPGVDVESHR